MTAVLVLFTVTAVEAAAALDSSWSASALVNSSGATEGCVGNTCVSCRMWWNSSRMRRSWWWRRLLACLAAVALLLAITSTPEGDAGSVSSGALGVRFVAAQVAPSRLQTESRDAGLEGDLQAASHRDSEEAAHRGNAQHTEGSVRVGADLTADSVIDDAARASLERGADLPFLPHSELPHHEPAPTPSSPASTDAADPIVSGKEEDMQAELLDQDRVTKHTVLDNDAAEEEPLLYSDRPANDEVVTTGVAGVGGETEGGDKGGRPASAAFDRSRRQHREAHREYAHPCDDSDNDDHDDCARLDASDALGENEFPPHDEDGDYNDDADADPENRLTAPAYAALTGMSGYRADVAAGGSRRVLVLAQRRPAAYNGVDHYTDTSHARSELLAEEEVVDDDGYMVAGTGDKAGDDGPALEGHEGEEACGGMDERTYLSAPALTAAMSSWAGTTVTPNPTTPTLSSSHDYSVDSHPSSPAPSAHVHAASSDRAMDTVADSNNVRTSAVGSEVGIRDGLTFNTKRGAQARWREYRGSYPTLRELIHQLVSAYKEEQRAKRACLSAITSQRRGSKGLRSSSNSSSGTNGGRAFTGGDDLFAAGCAASLPTLRTSLDWVRYLPYVPIYPIDEALKHLEHEADDDILLALFYAPDLFSSYNYIQWMGLMVKATCSLLRAGAMDPIVQVREDNDSSSASYCGVDGGAAAMTQQQQSLERAKGKAGVTESRVFCPALPLPSAEGLLRPEDVQRLRTNTVRIAIIDGYYPQRNVTRKLWEHLGTDTYMVNEDEWSLSPHCSSSSSSSSSDDDDGNDTAEATEGSNTCSHDGDDAAERCNGLSSSSENTTTSADAIRGDDRLPIPEKLQCSSEEWGPVFVEQRNALLRLLAREGSLFEDVQAALRPMSKPWRSERQGRGSGSSSNSGMTTPDTAADEAAKARPQGQQREAPAFRTPTGERDERLQQWREDDVLTGQVNSAVSPTGASVDHHHHGGNTQQQQQQHADRPATDTTRPSSPALRMTNPIEDNDRIHFLARYIIEHTDDLIVSRPQMLLKVLQRSFNRIRRREQRLVEKIFSRGQIMKYRVHVNVSAQRIDEFSSDHVCEVRYQVYLRSPHTFDGTSAATDVIGGDAAGGEERDGQAPRPKLGRMPTLWKDEQCTLSEDAVSYYDVDGLGSKASCYYYQQLRHARATAALGSASRLQQRPRRRSATFASATSAVAAKPRPPHHRSRRRVEVDAVAGEAAIATMNMTNLDVDGGAVQQQQQQQYPTRDPPHGTAMDGEGTMNKTTGASAEGREHVARAPAAGGHSSQDDHPPVDTSALAETDGSSSNCMDAESTTSAGDEVDSTATEEDVEGGDHDAGDKDADAFFHEVLSQEDERDDDFYEKYVQYVDGMDELALEDDTAVGSTFQQAVGDGGQADVQSTVAEAAGAPSSISTSASGAATKGGGGGGSVRGHTRKSLTDSPPGTSSGIPRGLSDTPANSLHLLGSAARRNYLLRQNPPVLLFPRKQGSRPYLFPQTLLQMVHLNFAGPPGQLSPCEHARRLRHRWGCEAPSSSSSTSSPIFANVSSSQHSSAGAAPPIQPGSCANDAALDTHIRTARPSIPLSSSLSEGGGRSSSTRGSGGGADVAMMTPATTASVTEESTTTTLPSFAAAAAEAAPTTSPPAPIAYRVVSVLDNPFSRIGVEHLHYDFVITGPSSPTAVLQLLVEEARRVSTPGELESRSHRESIYRLQHRQWLEARQVQRSARTATKDRRGATDAARAADNTGGGSDANHTAGAACAESEAVGIFNAKKGNDPTSHSCAATSPSVTGSHSHGDGNHNASAFNKDVDVSDTATSSQSGSHGEHDGLAQTEEEAACHERGNYHKTWGERLLENTAKDVNAYLLGGKAATGTGSAARHGSPPTTSTTRQEKHKNNRRTSREQGSLVSGGDATTEEEEEEYFFEHDVSFRLDPDRFVESAPLTLHFFLRTPAYVVEKEIIEPLREHVRVLRQRLVEEILADAYQYARCDISGNRFVQLLRRGVDAQYVNGTRVSPPPAEQQGQSISGTRDGNGADTPPSTPYAYTEEGYPLLMCLRNSAASWVWRLTAELQTQEIAQVYHGSALSEGANQGSGAAAGSARNTTGEMPALPYALPRDTASMLELLHMPYDKTLDPRELVEAEAEEQVFAESVPLYHTRFGIGRFTGSENAAAAASAKFAGMTEAEKARWLERRLTYERLFVMQLAFRELVKRSTPGQTESFFQLVVIDREAAMLIDKDDPSRTVHRTAPSPIASTSSLPVASAEPVYPLACLTPYNNSYMVVMYLFFNGTAERYYRHHPLNQRRVRLIQRLDEAVRLSRQARLILLTASEEDYRTQYVDSVIQDAARRFFVIRQINRNRDIATRRWEQQQQQRQQRLFSTERADAKGVLIPNGEGVQPLTGETSGAAAAAPTDAGPPRTTHMYAGTSAPSVGMNSNDDDDEEGGDIYESYAHLSPFQFNIINYDFDTSDGTLIHRRATKPGAAADAVAQQHSSTTVHSSSTATTAFASRGAGGKREVGTTDTASTSPADGSRSTVADTPATAKARRTGFDGNPSSNNDDDGGAATVLYGHEVLDSEEDGGLTAPTTAGAEFGGTPWEWHRMRVLRGGRVGGRPVEGGGGGEGTTAASLSSSSSSTWRRQPQARPHWMPDFAMSPHQPFHHTGDGKDVNEGRAAEEQRAVERSVEEEMAFFEEELRRQQRADRVSDDDDTKDAPFVPPLDTDAATSSPAFPQQAHQQQQPSLQRSRRSWWRWLLRRQKTSDTALHKHDQGSCSPADGCPGDHHGEHPHTGRVAGSGNQHYRCQNSEGVNKKSSRIWQREPTDVADDGDGDNDNNNDDEDHGDDDDFVQQNGFEQGDDDHGADMSHVITGGKAEYEEGLPFPWRHGEVPRQELRRRLEEHQRHVRELKRRLIDVRLRWASALWNDGEPAGGGAPSQHQEKPSPAPQQQQQQQ